MTVLWAVNVIAAKVALREFSVFTLTELRMSLSSVLLLPFFFRQPWQEELKLLRENFRTLLLLGLSGVAFNQILFVAAVKNTTVAHAAIIVAMTPVFVLIVARWSGLERFTLLKTVGLATCLAGVAALTMVRGAEADGSGPTLWGDFCAAAGSFAFAIFAVLAKKLTNRISPVGMTLSVFSVGAAIIFPIAAVELWRGSAASISTTGWGALAYMAVFSSVIAYVIFFWAMRRLEATRVTVLSYLQPVIVVLLGVIFLHERTTGFEIASAGVILAGVYMTERG